MLDEERIMHLNFFKYGGTFSSDHHGMRYRIARIGEKPDFKLQACVWPEPFSFDKTAEEAKTYLECDYSEDGRNAAVAWITGQYEDRKDEWDHAPTVYEATHKKEANVI